MQYMFSYKQSIYVLQEGILSGYDNKIIRKVVPW